MRRWKFRGRRTAGALVVLMLLLGAGIAYAAIPDDNGVIHGCYTNRGGILSVIDPSAGQHCSALQTPIDWNQQGPKGDTGPQGPQGDPGPQGPPGFAHGVFSSSGYFGNTQLGQNYTEVGRMTLSPGKWLVWGMATLANYTPSQWVPAGCFLGTTLQPDQQRGFVDLGGLTTGGSTQRMSIMEPVELQATAAVTLGCLANVDNPNVYAFHVQFSAIQVDQLEVTRTNYHPTGK
jgi:hypothetical protein